MSLRRQARERPRAVTLVVSVLGYALVIGSFAGLIPYPSIARGTVDLMSHVIALINTAALASILLGVYWIRGNDVSRHRKAMLTSFALILVFLVVYLVKVGGGGTKVFDGPDAVRNYIYLPMLAVHLVLSVVSVPVVLHAVVLGLTQPVEKLPRTSHPRVGRFAVVLWGVSLALGILTYVLLNLVYGWTYSTGVESLFLAPVF